MEDMPRNQVNTMRFLAASDNQWIAASVPAIHRRLLDLLNSQDSSTIMVQDVVVTERPDQAGPTAEYAALPLRSILFALPLVEVGTRESAKENFLWVQTTRHPARIDLGPYRLVGNVHLRPGSDLRDLLLTLSPRFYPLTEVTITRAGDPEFVVEKPVALFNGQRLDLALPLAEL